MGPRVALLGFAIECNRFAPVTAEAEFRRRCWLEGEALLADARAPTTRSLGEIPGFVQAMDAAGPWQPVPLMFCASEPNGPVETGAFARMCAQWRAGLQAAGPLDGILCVLHGAGLTEDDDDPEGTLQALIRAVRPEAKLVTTYDLHANISEAMVRHTDGFIGYRTNPHVDMRARGAEAAALLRRLIAGEPSCVAWRRLPIVPPTVSLLTAQGPYAEVIALGQARQAADARILNVSVMGGFAFSDTHYNGLAVVVTATERDAAEALAQALAQACWARRARFVARLTPLAEAVRLARESPVPLCFADVGDNPGGGGRGNTLWILRAMHAAGVQGALLGMLCDPALAAEAHGLGVGARFAAHFNRDNAADDAFSQPWVCEATVRALSDGEILGQAGLYAGMRLSLGAVAALDLGGITVVVGSTRAQCADPVFFTHLGLDVAAARAVVVKSRGHFRAAFEPLFPHARVVEVDAPGLTSPNLAQFAWRHLPRPVLPLDAAAAWA